MQVIINGKERDFPALSSVADLIAALDLKSDRVALEHNGTIVRRDTWHDTPIQSGDKFEIVHFVGGGNALHLFPGNADTEGVVS
jgi:thiamine biosynthesis protein ThiS